MDTLPKAVTAQDRLLFYFAGHGVALEGNDGPAVSSFHRTGIAMTPRASFRCRKSPLLWPRCHAGTCY